MDLQELSKANLVLFRPLHFCAAAFGLYWVVANFGGVWQTYHFQVVGCRCGTQYIPQENMKSATGFLRCLDLER